VVTGKCRVAGIGMRIDGRTRNAALVEQWATGLGLAHLGTIREAQAYARCLDQGMSIFDMPPAKVAAYLTDWSPVSAWIDQVLAGPQVTETAEPERRGAVLARPSPHAASVVVAPVAREAPAFLRT